MDEIVNKMLHETIDSEVEKSAQTIIGVKEHNEAYDEIVNKMLHDMLERELDKTLQTLMDLEKYDEEYKESDRAFTNVSPYGNSIDIYCKYFDKLVECARKMGFEDLSEKYTILSYDEKPSN